MKLRLCYDSHGLTVVCDSCKKRLPLSRATADLDGRPFEAYYCGVCANDLRIHQVETAS